MAILAVRPPGWHDPLGPSTDPAMSIDRATRAALCALALTALHQSAECRTTVRVTVRGTVAFNQISSPPMNAFAPGNAALLRFTVDSGVFTDSVSFPTRGYVIDASSFALASGLTSVGLQSPFPPAETPYFVIRDDDPAVDGFFTSTSVDFPTGVPLAPVGVFGNFENDFSVTYDGATLPSLDVLDALGTYDFTGLSVFNWTVNDGGFQPLGIDFTEMTIECVAEISTYCTAGTTANGCRAAIAGTGTPSASSGSGFDISVSNVDGGRNGLVFYGISGPTASPWGMGAMTSSSFLCVKAPTQRTPPGTTTGTVGACDGTFSVDFNAFIAANPSALGAPFTVGDVVDAQFWFRDPPSPNTTHISNGLEFTVCP